MRNSIPRTAPPNTLCTPSSADIEAIGKLLEAGDTYAIAGMAIDALGERDLLAADLARTTQQLARLLDQHRKLLRVVEAFMRLQRAA